MEVQIVSSSGKPIVTLDSLASNTTVMDVKQKIQSAKKGPYPGRQMLRMEPRGKALADEDTLASKGFKSGDKLFLKDLGPQMGWSTVFLCEYAGPLVVYLWVYSRPWIFYGTDAALKPYSSVANLAAVLWTFHYAKRVLETLFVHRFSHATMPLANLFKNCSYYWGFAGYISYHVSHPLYTPPCCSQVWVSAALFMLFELGNLSIHILLRGLRPEGSKARKIPYPTGNPLTILFKYVSCPNYTYEVYAWAAFAVMTQCLPAALFMLAGLFQMSIWALGKHRNYKKEFPNYPKGRTAIIPYLL